MLFSTFDYFIFLPLVAVGHWLLGGKQARTALLLVASAIFYLAWNPVDSLILLWVGAVGFAASHLLGRLAPAAKVPTLWGVAALMLGPLFFYK